MFHYLMSFSSEAAAKANPNMATWLSNNNWDLSRVIPAAQQWNPANDTTSQQTVNGQTVNVTTHQYSTNFQIVIASPVRIPALEADANFVLWVNRDLANSGGLPAQYIVAFKASLFPNIVSLMNAARFQPVFSGSHYPALGVA